jgi:ribosomal protein S19
VKGLVMSIERVRHSGAYVISQFIGEGAGEYLFTRTYYGYTLKQAKAQFRLAIESEGK